MQKLEKEQHPQLLVQSFDEGSFLQVTRSSEDVRCIIVLNQPTKAFYQPVHFLGLPSILNTLHKSTLFPEDVQRNLKRLHMKPPYVLESL